MPADTLRALTLHAPWAWAVTHLPVLRNGKRVENRTRPPPKRLVGQRFALHAGKASPREAWELVADLSGEPTPDLETVPHGAVTAVVTLYGWMRDHGLPREGDLPAVECVTADGLPPRLGVHTFSPWRQAGHYWWLLSEVVRLPEPVPARGQLGVWRLPADVDAAVRVQLERARELDLLARRQTPAEVGRHFGGIALQALGGRQLSATSRGRGWPDDWSWVEEKCGRPLTEQDRAEALRAYHEVLCEPGGSS